MEQDFIYGEVENELNRGADRRCDCERKSAAEVELIDAHCKYNGVEPRREADKRNGEHNINRKRYRGVRAGIERFFFVDKE